MSPFGEHDRCMTTPTSSHDPLEDWRTPLRISDPAELIVSVPALLGFTPTRSIVVLCLGGGGRGSSAVGAVLRHDLVRRSGGRGGVCAEMAAALDQFGVVCAAENAAAALVVIVDDAGDRTDYDDIVESLAHRLHGCGTELVGAHVTPRIVAGQRWWSLLGDPRYGCLPDPTASRVAAAHVLSGRQIHASRAEMSALLLGDPGMRQELVDELSDSPTTNEDSRARAHLVLWRVAAVASGERLSPREFAHVILAIADGAVRDACMALAVGDDAEPAEQLWLALTQLAPDTHRADAAALLGYSAYVRGDGPFAGIALSAALDSDPTHVLAVMLDSALTHGLRPDRIRELSRTGFERARRLGVTLPPEISRPDES